MKGPAADRSRVIPRFEFRDHGAHAEHAPRGSEPRRRHQILVAHGEPALRCGMTRMQGSVSRP